MRFTLDVDFDDISDDNDDVDAGDNPKRRRACGCGFSLLPCKVAKQQGINDVFTDDMLIEILSRLPSKLAIQCKSVCTRWNALISSPCLLRRLIAHHYKLGWNSREGLMIHGFRDQLLITRCQPDDLPLSATVSLDFLPCFQGGNLRGAIVSSCNGLLLCCSDCLYDDTLLYVCNPFTRQWVAIPPAPLPSRNLNGHAPIGFICDPFYRLDEKGHVILNPICRFKIFRPYATPSYSDMNFDVDIFSSETGEWSKIKASCQRIHRSMITYGLTRVVVHNGRLYFQVGGNIVVYDPSSCKICGDIDLPEDPEMDLDPHEGLSCSRGSLWMCRWHNWSKRLCVFRLKEEQESSGTLTVQSWSLERQVNLLMCSGFTRNFIDSIRVLAFHPDDPDILLLSSSYKGVNMSWNLRTGAMEVIGTCEPLYYPWVNSFFLEVPVWPTPVPHTGTRPGKTDSDPNFRPDLPDPTSE